MQNFDERTVIVLDNSNYNKDYAEEVPFKALVQEVYDNEISVRSLVTGKEYELYKFQILETMDIGEIKFMLRMDQYGMYDYSKLIKEGKFFK